MCRREPSCSFPSGVVYEAADRSRGCFAGEVAAPPKQRPGVDVRDRHEERQALGSRGAIKAFEIPREAFLDDLRVQAAASLGRFLHKWVTILGRQHPQNAVAVL